MSFTPGNQLGLKHGHARKNGSLTYRKWKSMKNRCQPTTKVSREDYFERGIQVCDRWQSFDAFLEDMGNCPVGYEIDRIDNSKGYFKGNCRWTTHLNNQRNRRKSVSLFFNGLIKTAKEWSIDLGIPYPTIIWRARQNWPTEKVLSLCHFR